MKRYFIAIIGLVLTTFYISSCSSEGGSGTEGTTDTLTIAEPDTFQLVVPEDSVASIDTLVLDIASLDELIAKQSDALQQLYQSYRLKISTPDAITEEANLKRIFTMRDSLINMLQYDVLENHFFGELDGNYEAQDTLIKALQTLGIQVVSAEGMYAGLAEAPILQDKINEVGSEAYQLFIAFKQAYGNSLGSEYSYDNLVPEMEMIKIGEELRSKFPDSEYIELTKENYEAAQLVLTDFHVTLQEDSTEQYWIVGGIQTEFYPSGTNHENFKNFVQNYPNTKLSKLTEKVLQNPSGIYNTDAADTLYLLTTDWVSTWSQAREIALKNIEEGFDATHCISITTAEGDKYVVAYRYYPSRNQAEENLPYAKKEVELVTVLHKNGELEKIEEL